MCNCDGAIIVLTALVFLKFVEVIATLADWAWRTKMAKQCDEVFGALMKMVPPPAPANANPFTFGKGSSDEDEDEDEGDGEEESIDGDKKEE